MVQINVHEAKTHFSRYLKRAAQGETIVVCLRNVPIAQITPLPSAAKGRRPLGLYKGQFKVTEAFFDPLPDDLLDLFEGKGE